MMVLAAGAAGYMIARQLQSPAPSLQSGTALPQPRPMPQFELEDHQGAPFGNTQLSGKPSLLFFGFTHCPDVCPTTLALMAQLAREPALKDLRQIFVTVDPDRDNREMLQRYVDAFGGGMIGIRGEDAALKPLLEGIGVAHMKQPLPGGGYTVDHSATLFYIDRTGHLAAVFSPPFSLDALRADLAVMLGVR